MTTKNYKIYYPLTVIYTSVFVCVWFNYAVVRALQ